MIRPVTGLAIEEQPIPVLRRMVVWAEARGEPVVGQLAVLYVVENRSSKWQKGVKDVILQPFQFSSFNADDPNRARLLDAWKIEPETWGQSDAVCALKEAQMTLDPTHGALYYYNPKVANPKWGRGNPAWKEYASYGNHIFGMTG